MEADKFPLDVSKMQKGCTYDMTKVMECSPGTAAARLEMLGLRDYMQQQADILGLCMSMRIVGDRHIRVMTDSEASEYHDQMAEAGVRKLGRALRRQQRSVDQDALTEDQQRRHQHSLARRWLQYHAVRLPTKALRKRLQRTKEIGTEHPKPFSNEAATGEG